MLTLDLVRHGRALPSSPTGEMGRLLSAEGEAQVRDLAAILAAAGFQPGRVFASPLARARQTALLLAAAARPPVEVETLPELVPEHESDGVLRALEALGAVSGHVVLVGHMPQLAALCALLTGADLGFAPGMLRRIECRDGPAPGRGELVLELPKRI